uniref:Uncharacterized protein n=1 Tax=Strombidium inclinatum TaxID=197538 RepID=A0A7S3IM38_9SPIT|mmetsp:Transcript_28001/g.42342  ORF Transcript_28001/g.42342 Transcript_28001/m.42342 type:complete len:123 (+) Transcript_28001:1219-1587(+)
MQYWASLLAEAINIYLLAYQHTVDHCIIHFVALEVIMEMSKLYLEALPDENIKEVLHHHVAIKNRGRDIKFAKRSGFHKFARVLYKVMRALYVAVIFYFIPYTVWFLNFWLAEVGVHSDKSH